MEPPQEPGKDPPHLYELVVIGASAGGIEALSVLVSTVPHTLPVPVVIAQHLDPNVPSHLAQILARRSTLPVRSVDETDPTPLSSGTIYVVPADRDVEIIDGAVRLRPGVLAHPMPSVDRLFTSAARMYGERVIAVVLTGSGSDGTAGARAIKAAGGTVLIENPQTASYPTMPASLPPTSVDLVVDLQRMGSVLADLISGAETLTAPPADDTMPALLEQVRQQTGIDFGQYKTPTIMRRLHRRMAAVNAETLNEYRKVLQEHPEEYQHLLASFLINVTEFFRDPPLYAYLQEHILPDVIANARTRGTPHEIRIWSAGCSTGEEPYSIALLLAELLGPDVLSFIIRIFATDVDADAVAFARRGLYPASAIARVPERLRARYFTPVNGGFEIAKSIRSMVIFGEHDLGQRAPFPHMDLVSCRNVLIYFTPELQLHSLQLFAFSLRDGGYLVLGNAESAGPLAANFGQVHPHFKIYRRQGDRILVPPVPIGGRPVYVSELPFSEVPLGGRRLRLLPSEAPASGNDAAVTLHSDERSAVIREFGQRVYTARERFADQILSLPIGVVVVDSNYDVLTINSAAYALLEIHRPAIGRDLVHLAEQVPSRTLRAAIDAAFDPEMQDVAQHGVQVTIELDPGVADAPEPDAAASDPTGAPLGEPEHTAEPGAHDPSLIRQITCYPHLTTGFATDGSTVPKVEAAILFITEVPPASLPSLAAPVLQPTVGSAQAQTPQRMPMHVDAERAHERELRRANEELRQENDNLRRTNEDLIVTQEEVQASSEEVKTFNEEMQATNEELETLNEELEATVEELHTTNDDLGARAREMQTVADEREEQRQASERARAQLAAILTNLGDAVYAVDAQGQPVLTNDAYQRLFGHAEVAVLEDESGQALPPSAAPWRRLGEGAPFHVAFSLRAPDGSRHWFDATGQPIFAGEERLGAVLTIRDLSDFTLRSIYERFLGQVAHEMATPLAVLMTRLQQLERRLAAPAAAASAGTAEAPDGTGAQVRQMAANTLRSARQLATLVDDLRDLQRVQREQLALAREPVDLVALAQRVAEDLSLIQTAEQPASPIVVQAELGRHGPVMVLGDAARLEQVLRNLVSNALRYAADSERIDVRIRRVHERGAPEMAELEVQDYGAGIPAADLPYVFMPFYQAPQSRAANKGGLGLGLYIVQQLVQAHGGSIEARSPAGRGTVFTVQLPLAPATVPARKPGARAEGQQQAGE